ncbi:hypothetical protein L596_002949 [Steinernema carpocapsae]|uniref:Uncharacterized protein n=1 Tax=Steinernema carpocapsae TaxID=34508 RepID=A0A4V6YSV6_STECR|nr:hypothetical protein L596_002949 [Steinernema carpocapsae]
MRIVDSKISAPIPRASADSTAENSVKRRVHPVAYRNTIVAGPVKMAKIGHVPESRQIVHYPIHFHVMILKSPRLSHRKLQLLVPNLIP